MKYQSFKLESLNLDMKEQSLTINGKEVSLNGITDFGLFHDGVAWKFNCKRDVTCEVAETHIKEPPIQHQGASSEAEGIYEATRILAFNDQQKETGEKILALLKGMTVEEGMELLEKCIFQHSYHNWDRNYMTEPLPYGIGPVLKEKKEGGAEVGKNRISLVNTLRAAFKVILILEDEKIPYGMFEEVMESVKSIIAVTPIKHNPSDENHFSFPK